VIDSPPLTEVIDALPIAQQVDDVVLVVRLGSSRLVQLERLGDLLAQHGIKPAGFAVVGAGTSERESYYLSSRRELFSPEASSGGGERSSGQRPARTASSRSSQRRTPSARG
jgi:Mrp family chromosome partitioning ATPase